MGPQDISRWTAKGKMCTDADSESHALELDVHLIPLEA
jgi:hypothetical protein